MNRLKSIEVHLPVVHICQNCLSENFEFLLIEGGQILWCDQCGLFESLTEGKKNAKILPFKRKGDATCGKNKCL